MTPAAHRAHAEAAAAELDVSDGTLVDIWRDEAGQWYATIDRDHERRHVPIYAESARG